MAYSINQLEVNLMSEFKKRPKYHIEALYFITQTLTNDAPVEDISKLIVLLKAKTGTIEDAMTLLKNCLSMMAEHDSSFNYYLQHFPGGSDYEEQPPAQMPAVGSENGATHYPSRPVERPNMDERLTDAFLINLHNHLDVHKLDNFAVAGLDITMNRVGNAIDGCTTAKEKFANILKIWKQEAPTDSMQLSGMPSFTKRGLRKALERATLNDAIKSLELV